jgi:hypothetical protein
VSIDLPVDPTNGASVSFCDLTGTFSTNNLTIGRNGKTIMGLAEDLTIDTDNASFSLAYSAKTGDWRIVSSNI